MNAMFFNGYVYELAEYIPPPLWIKADSDFWDVVMVSPASEEKRAVQELGVRTIDRTRCMVFLCADGKIRALTMVAARAAKQVGG